MNGMIKRLMVVMLAVFMVFGMVITPAEAKGGKGHKPQPTPETTVESEVPEAPVPEENVEETEESEESEEAAEEELPAVETVTEETELADEEAVNVEAAENAVEEEPAEEVEVEITGEEAVEAEEITAVEDPGVVRNLALADAGLLAEETRAVGAVPPHTKNITDNHDGTYTLSLDVVGDSEKKPNNVNVIVIVDTSGSMTQQRMSAAKNAVNNLANSLYAYNTTSAPDTVQMALVRFATSSSVAQQPTNSATTFRSAVNNLGTQGNGGTNWESALQTANGINFGDDDQTFAVFVSDGNPTFRTTQNGWNDWSSTYQQWGNGRETDTNIYRCYTTAVDDAQALAQKVGVNNFFTIGAFGNVDRMQQLTTDAGAPAANYYSAQDTAALNKAISDILAKIEMVGIGNTSIEDGTTNQVTTTSGEIAELLEVDTSSFKYYRSGGSYGASMVAWTDAPEASFTNGNVDWDLSKIGVLENGVKYTVTFDVYPSQFTYDTIAQLKNGDITYDSLDAEIKKYIVDNGGGNYSLRTNTNATLSYDDTRDEAGQQSADYTNPDPVGTDADTLTINKEWVGGKPDVDSLELTVLMEGAQFHTATLSKANNWSTNAYISLGVIKNGVALSGAEGHDFSFAELGDEQYHWELDAPTVRPMLVDGDVTMLVKVDAKHPAPSGATTYTIEDATYYVDSAAGGLTATNIRRSYLDVKKTVESDGAKDPNAENIAFDFTMKVVNSRAAAGTADNTDSDYYVWFSVVDSNNGNAYVIDDALVTGEVTRATENGEYTGYYYMRSGTEIHVNMKDGYSLRFLNLPSSSTYEVAESATMPNGDYSFVNIEGGTVDSGNPQKVTGTIENANDPKTVRVTNKFTPHFYVYHSSVEGNGDLEVIPYTEGMTFNIFGRTKEGTLYGGYYSDYAGKGDYVHGTGKAGTTGVAYNGMNETWDYTKAYEENGTAMHPVAGETYYIKEVPTYYLRNYYQVNYVKAAPQTMKGLYLVSAIDDNNYSTVGFKLNSEEKTNGVRVGKTISFKNWATGLTVTLKPNSAFFLVDGKKAITVAGVNYLTFLDLTAEEYSEYYQPGTFTVLPYWTTFDGITVNGVSTRTITITSMTKSGISKVDSK